LAFANNAFNLVGYGAESVAMGGADSAIADSPFSVNSNPAGLAQIHGQMLDLSATGFLKTGLHEDQIGNGRKDANEIAGGWGAGGYVRHIEGSPYTLGAALFIQGGTGSVYKHLKTVAFGNRDEVTSAFGVVKFSPGIGWQVNENLRVGASIGINYSTVAQTFFPNTSVNNGFSGINFKDATGIGFSGRIGLQYRPMEDVNFGLVYGSRTKIPMKGGTLRVNYTNQAGIGSIVRYDDAQLKGFRLPQEITFGVAFRPIKPLLVSIEETWYDWDEVVNTLSIVAKNPRSTNPLVPATITLSSPLNLNDQHVYKLGLLYDYDDQTKLSFGVNYGANVLPMENLSPGLPIISTIHYFFGVTRQFNPEWSGIAVLEYLPKKTFTYTNASGLWGNDAKATLAAYELHLAAVRRW
jgi:long-chain fatty acid transport protein